jgi:hypothetical protein
MANKVRNSNNCNRDKDHLGSLNNLFNLNNLFEPKPNNMSTHS